MGDRLATIDMDRKVWGGCCDRAPKNHARVMFHILSGRPTWAIALIFGMRGDRRRNYPCQFLANVNSRSRSLYATARPSVVCLSSVCNTRAPYSGGSNFGQYFCGIRYASHPLTSTENFTEIVPGEPLRRES